MNIKKIDTKGVLKRLFKKHMDLGPTRPQYVEFVKKYPKETFGMSEPKQATDRDFEEQYYHQLEYLNWTFNGDEVEYYGCSYGQKPILLGLFWGQENKLKLIFQEFSIYFKNIKNEIIKKIIEATNKLHAQDIPCEKLYINTTWLDFFNESNFIGMKIIESDTNKIQSPDMYGRFVTI